MTISLVASDANSDTGGGGAPITLAGTEGNLQVVVFGHRSASLTPSITGDGWSAPYLIETQIGNASARRAAVMYWRVVPAGQSAAINTNWSAAGSKAVVGYEFATDTVGGTWSFSISAPAGRNTNDNGTVGTTSLASNSVTPQFAEAVAVDAVITRHGAPATEDSYSNSFITGVSAATGTGSSDIAAFSGRRIVDTAPTATSTTASWTTSALATSIIGMWSVDSGAAAETVILAGTLPALTGGFDVDTSADVQLAGTLPALTGDFAIQAESDVQFNGTLPALTGAFDIEATGDVQLAGTLPALTADFGIAAEADMQINGTLPGLTGDFDIATTADVQLAGTLPALIGDFTIATPGSVTLTGALPALTGSFDVGSSADVELVGVLPAPQGSFIVVTPGTVILVGTLPALQGEFLIGVGAGPPDGPHTLVAIDVDHSLVAIAVDHSLRSADSGHTLVAIE